MPLIHILHSSNMADELSGRRDGEPAAPGRTQARALPWWGIHTLAAPATAARVGEGGVDQGYVQVTARIAPGRPQDLRRTITSASFETVDAVVSTAARRPVGYQVDVSEFQRLTTRSGGTLPGSPTAG